MYGMESHSSTVHIETLLGKQRKAGNATKEVNRSRRSLRRLSLFHRKSLLNPAVCISEDVNDNL